jgi:alkylhydroperoxidase/carboxymuconolactone decarboxylase family protein YurZ
MNVSQKERGTMEILLLLAVVAVIWFVWSSRRIQRMNSDPFQRELASLFIEAATGDEKKAVRKIIEMIVEKDLSQGQTASRIAHAISMVKIMAPADVYDKAVHIGRGLSEAYQ